MDYDEYLAISSEINELESLLSEIPEENVIDRMGLQARLRSARAAVSGLTEHHSVPKTRLTFRGRPVHGSHGIAADFATRAAGEFVDAIAVIAAGLNDNLRYMGPIPDRQKNQLLITGTAIGSFGFEFELPPPENSTLFPEPSNAENAVEKMQELFRLAAEGSDDDVAELVDEIHPRAVKKVAEFLDHIAQQEAWCGLELKDRFFRFRDIEQLSSSVSRLKEDNIREIDEEHVGEFQGVLPSGRFFEFKAIDQHVLKGKVSSEVADVDLLNREYLHKLVKVKFHVIQVGQGRPRYSLTSLDAIDNASDAWDQK